MEDEKPKDNPEDEQQDTGTNPASGDSGEGDQGDDDNSPGVGSGPGKTP